MENGCWIVTGALLSDHSSLGGVWLICSLKREISGRGLSELFRPGIAVWFTRQHVKEFGNQEHRGS
jgi:hypothetical protein